MRRPTGNPERSAVEANSLIGPGKSPGYDKYVAISLGPIFSGLPPPNIEPVANLALGLAWADHGMGSEAELNAFLHDLGYKPEEYRAGLAAIGYDASPVGAGVHRLQPLADALRGTLVLSIRVTCQGSIAHCLPNDIDPKTYDRWRRRAGRVLPQFDACIAASLDERLVVLGSYRCDPVPKADWAEFAKITNRIGGHPTERRNGSRS